MLTQDQKLVVANYLATNKDIKLNDRSFHELMGFSEYTMIAKHLNKKTNPVVTIWKPSVTRDEIINAINFSDYIALTAAKRDGAGALLLCSVFDFTNSRVRFNFIDIFGEGSDTKIKVFAKCDKIATNLEALFTVNNVTEIFGYEIAETELIEIFSMTKTIIKTPKSLK